MSVPAPTFADVLAAKHFLASHITPTPLVQRPAVSAALDLDVWLKCESLLPTAAFKVRGGLNLLGRDPTARAGVMGASTGNHGQSLAYAGKVFGVPVTIYVPRNANPLKLAAMRASGATLVEHGVDFDEARIECARRARADGVRYVHSGDEPYLIAGVATAALEVLETLPSAEVLIVPVGGGSGVAGACLVAKTVNPKIIVIGVQSDGAPSAYLSWRDRAPREMDRINTFADGLATRTPFELPQRMMRELLDDLCSSPTRSSTPRCVCSSSRATSSPRVRAPRRSPGRESSAIAFSGAPSCAGSAVGTRPRNRCSARSRHERLGSTRGLRPHPRAGSDPQARARVRG